MKTVLVTGSAKGIGKELIIEFARNNYNVVINYLTSKKEAMELKRLVEKKYGVKALTIKVDISKENEVKNMFKIIKDNLNTLDVIINNAAYVKDNSFLEKTKEEFMRVLEVNVVGTFLVTKYGINLLKKGTVINVSSTDAVDTYNELSMDYCASKAAINMLTKTFSIAVKGIKFISVMPVWVNTEEVKKMYRPFLEEELKRTKQKRLLEPEEVAIKIFEIYSNKKILSGDIIKIGE